jgi:hypothetical protein
VDTQFLIGQVMRIGVRYAAIDAARRAGVFPPIQTRSVSAGCADLRLTTTAARQTLVNAQSAGVVNIRSAATQN